MKTFTLYRADVYNSYESGSVPVFDTFYHLDGDLSNWDTQDEYQLRDGWSFVDGKGEDFSYLTTKAGNVINVTDIGHDKQKDAPYVWLRGKNGMAKVFFVKVEV